LEDTECLPNQVPSGTLIAVKYGYMEIEVVYLQNNRLVYQ